MAIDVDRFLEAEKTADQLLTTLEALRSEVGSYKTAGQELSAVRARLAEFLTLTEQIVGGTRLAVSTLASVGGPEILSRLEHLKDAAAQSGTDLARVERTIGEKFSEADVRIGATRQVALYAAIASALALLFSAIGVLR